MNRFLFILISLLLALPASAMARAAERYASITVYEDTAEVLHARHADQLRHPASLTKVMTLYMLFEAVEQGDVGLDDVLRVSSKAAKAKPSKLGLKSGTTISVEDAIRALVTKSANDVAIVVAERLAGGEAKFAGQMTARARQLGMKRTRFANASGLPDRRQVTTARDISILAAAIRKDFPKQFHYFSLEKFIYDGTSYGNHNSLVGRIDGVDGLKTGYTNASGYNVAVTAKRNGKRVIVVVFGGATATQRDSHASDLINAAYKEIDKRGNLMERLALARFPARANALGSISDLEETAVQAPAGLADQIAQGSADKRGVRIIIVGEEAAPAVTVLKAKPANQWLVQVGAYSRRDQAQSRINVIKALNLPELSEAAPIVEASERAGKTLFRARFKNLGQSSAAGLCKTLSHRGEACFPLASSR